MGRRGRKRAEQESVGAAVLPEPVHPIETWSVEMPFDISEWGKRVAVPTYDETEEQDASE